MSDKTYHHSISACCRNMEKARNGILNLICHYTEMIENSLPLSKWMHGKYNKNVCKCFEKTIECIEILTLYKDHSKLQLKSKWPCSNKEN